MYCAEIRDFVDSIARLHPPRIARRYRGDSAADLCGRIMATSGKGLAESVLILRCAVDHLAGEDFFAEAADHVFERFAEERADELLGLCARKSVQANFPERALPITEVARSLTGGGPFALIELGASAGLIGACLLEVDRAVAGSSDYFAPGQQLPAATARAAVYLGIDRDPPASDWALSCIPARCDRERVRRFYADFLPAEGFSLVRADAFGFASLPAVRAVAAGDGPLVLLTSFLLYQLDPARRAALAGEIRYFASGRPGTRWINLDARPGEPDPTRQYYLEVDGEEWLALSDDSCRSWKPA